LLIRKGLWSAKGSVVYEGSSLGVPVEVDLEIVEDQDGITLTGALEGAARGNVSVRIGADENGTYVVDARVGSFAWMASPSSRASQTFVCYGTRARPSPPP
jgi:hypothetical protein